MDVPLFPAPPTLEGAPSSLSDTVDVARPARVPSATVACPRERNAPKSRATSRAHRIRRSARRNLVHPRPNEQFRQRVTEFRITMTERDRNDEDDDDVVCAIDTPTTVSEELSPEHKPVVEIKKSVKSIAVQTIIGLPLRLRLLPSVKDIVEDDNVNSADAKKSLKIWKHIRFLGRLSLSLFGLTWLLTIWAIVGAVVFCAIEGPREREQVVTLKHMQKSLAVGLATELRQIRTEKEEDVEPLWADKVHEYVAKHEEVLLMAVSAGYGENGNSGQLWTFPGCILFSISLLTTLGFGAPVPRTTAGRIITVIFAAIGIPAHFLLVMNFGLILALRLQRYAISRIHTDYNEEERKYLAPVPKWVKVVPFVCVATYYLLGILGFGVARSRPFAASVLFPLDFTTAGGLSTIMGYVRILYGLYLEGAVAITAVAVAVLRVSATQNLTHIGLKYGLLIEA
ncbi:PREDICTED: TWiK family of potassium channels protein 7-like [Dufourea novaeangliae]|uniref:TWiK family of potassium channels protein 7 n=1 Tax=Dufourea novaeangliae TaxID=178035 RepID=A0A154PDR7_DUFNO|nr:PREDICTED: TWiK family of potassium channels protein 7-like [Dufourea novaeangliae]KZC09947.1 TWiK family of potassium channels protein 7 [Dufourea novaeangliae]